MLRDTLSLAAVLKQSTSFPGSDGEVNGRGARFTFPGHLDIFDAAPGSFRISAMPTEAPQAVILMGVAGSGKTAVGKGFAIRLNWLFLDADDFHPAANIEKMKHGIALNDQDRLPWLQTLNQELRRHLANGRSLVLGCSALKERYRQLLSDHVSPLKFILLDVDEETIRQRLRHRSAHFFPKELMESQFAALEKPKEAIVVDARKPLQEVIDQVVQAIRGNG